MTVITPGSGGTFQATTAEGQLMEAILWFQLQEKDDIKNPSKEDRIRGSKDYDRWLFTGTWSIPVGVTINANGTLNIAAQNYLTNLSFSAGAGGTFKSASAPAYFLEVINYIISLQNDSTKNPNNHQYVSARLERGSKPEAFSGSFSLPFAMSNWIDSAVPYLL